MSVPDYIIAEYTALKQEQVSRIALRETALYTCILMNISVLAAYFTEVGSKHPLPLIVPLVSFVMFFIYTFNDGMISRIREYITDQLRPVVGITDQGQIAFGWENYHRKWTVGYLARKVFRIVVVWLAFSGLTILALWITLPIGLVALSEGFNMGTSVGVLATIWWAGIFAAAMPYLLIVHLIDL